MGNIIKKEIIKDIKKRLDIAKDKLKEVDIDINGTILGDYIDMNLYQIKLELLNYVNDLTKKLEFWNDQQ